MLDQQIEVAVVPCGSRANSSTQCRTFSFNRRVEPAAGSVPARQQSNAGSVHKVAPPAPRPIFEPGAGRHKGPGLPAGHRRAGRSARLRSSHKPRQGSIRAFLVRCAQDGRADQP